MNPLLLILFLFRFDGQGSPYFPETYQSATITLKQGRILSNVKARVNMVSMEANILSNGFETTLASNLIKEIAFSDTSDNKITSFRLKNGFPPVDKLPAAQIYLVLADGKCSFLKAITKKVTEHRNQLTSQDEKDYETVEEYYLFANGSMKRWKKDRDFMLAELADQKDKLELFIREHKTSFRSEESVAQLVNYYNTLSP